MKTVKKTLIDKAYSDLGTLLEEARIEANKLNNSDVLKLISAIDHHLLVIQKNMSQALDEVYSEGISLGLIEAKKLSEVEELFNEEEKQMGAP